MGKNQFDYSKVRVRTIYSYASDNLFANGTADNATVSLNNQNVLSGTASPYIAVAIPFRFQENKTIYNNAYTGERSVLVYDNSGNVVAQISSPTTSYTPNQTFDGYLGVGIKSGVDVTGEKIMFSYENNADFEPYQSQSYTIDFGDLEFCGFGGYQDYPHKLNGTWYKHAEIGKVVLDGSDGTWITQTTTGFYRYGIAINETNNTSSLSNTVINYSNYFRGITFNNRNTDVSETIYPTTNNVDHQIWFNTNVATTLDGFKTWLSTHNTIVYYVLATPTEEEITDENLISQLEAVKLLSGTQNNFTIDADTLPTLNLNYIGEASPHL